MTTYITNETNVEEKVKDTTNEQEQEQAKEQAKEQDEPACGICYTPLNNKNTVITTCNHAYCTTCFFKWLNRKETCALCRKVLLSDKVVEERLTALQDVQSELMDNYRCLRVLERNIKKKRCEKNNLTDDINSLLNRQIRMRYLLQETRTACRDTLANSKLLKKSLELQRVGLDLMQNYKREWEDLRTPDQVLAEEESEEESEEEEEIDVVNMTLALDNMIRLESRRARTALRRMRETERAAAETIDAGSSDENDNNEEGDAEEERIAMGFSDATEDENEDIEVDLTVFGTGIPTFDFTPLQTVVTARNHRQSPMFVFGATASESDFETPNTPSTIENPPRTSVELTDSLQESSFEWTPINLEVSATTTRLIAPAEMEPTSTDE